MNLSGVVCVLIVSSEPSVLGVFSASRVVGGGNGFLSMQDNDLFWYYYKSCDTKFIERLE